MAFRNWHVKDNQVIDEDGVMIAIFTDPKVAVDAAKHHNVMAPMPGDTGLVNLDHLELKRSDETMGGLIDMIVRVIDSEVYAEPEKFDAETLVRRQELADLKGHLISKFIATAIPIILKSMTDDKNGPV